MPDITLRDIPSDELAALRARAARHSRTLEAELQHLIRQAALEETLLAGLDRAAEAVDERLERAAHTLGDSATRTRRRYRSVEPTRRR